MIFKYKYDKYKKISVVYVYILYFFLVNIYYELKILKKMFNFLIELVFLGLFLLDKVMFIVVIVFKLVLFIFDGF